MEKKDKTVSDKKEFRKQLRRKLAASLGYADIASACDQFAVRGAELVAERIFSKTLSDEEKAPYISMVKNLGLRYKPSENEKDRKPTMLALRKALSGR